MSVGKEAVLGDTQAEITSGQGGPGLYLSTHQGKVTRELVI